jgi:hypothetical protein
MKFATSRVRSTKPAPVECTVSIEEATIGSFMTEAAVREIDLEVIMMGGPLRYAKMN